MKRVFNLVFAVLLISQTLLVFPHKTQSAGLPDCECDDTWIGSDHWYENGTTQLLTQSFTPENINHVSKVTIKIEGQGVGKMRLLLYKEGGGLLVENTNGDLDIQAGIHTLEFYFNDPEVTQGSHDYRIMPVYSDIDIETKLLTWLKGNCSYLGGRAYINSNAQAYDYGFQVYGFYADQIEDPGADEPVIDEPANDSTPQESTVDSPSTQGEDLAVTDENTYSTSSYIKAPTSVKAADVPKDEGGSIKISWKASTTSGVSGYKIYRSDKEKGDYERIGAVISTAKSYTDSHAETDKEYFYYVKTVKNNSQSNASLKVSAKSIDNLAPKAPSNFKLINSNLESINFGWDKNTEKDLDGYYLIISDKEDSSDTPLQMIEIEKDKTSFELKKSEYANLDQDKEYFYYLSAKDTHGNISDKAGPVKASFTISEPQSKTSSISIIVNIVAGIIIVILAGLLYWLYRKDKKKKIV